MLQERGPSGGQNHGLERAQDPRYQGLYPDLRQLVDTDREVSEWTFAPIKLIKYHGVKSDEAVRYPYKPGLRLVIKIGKEWVQVMDTCEFPWTKRTVDLLVKTAKEENPALLSEPMRVAELGFGTGMSGNLFVAHFHSGAGGEYRVGDLNLEVSENARKWKAGWDEKIEEEKRSAQVPANIKTVIYNTESRLFYKYLLSRGLKFDIVLSDTYPLKPEEKGLNDLMCLDQVLKLLKPTGVFSFFPFVGHASEEERDQLKIKQHELLSRYFKAVVEYDPAEVSPPPSYTYLMHTDGKMVRELPVIICSRPRQQFLEGQS